MDRWKGGITVRTACRNAHIIAIGAQYMAASFPTRPSTISPFLPFPGLTCLALICYDSLSLTDDPFPWSQLLFFLE